MHCVTRKGRGFQAAEEHEEDRFHAVGRINEITGEPLSASVQATWTDAFAEAMVQIGQRRPGGGRHGRDASSHGPRPIRRRIPGSAPSDVGIAEQHAVVSAAGLARSGLHPVVALYATFLNRAFDQVLMDASLHGVGLTIALDRAGITGTDGPSHNGMWDMSLLGVVPGVQLAAPRDQARLVAALDRAVSVDDAVTVVRYSKERLPDELPEVAHVGGPVPRGRVAPVGRGGGPDSGVRPVRGHGYGDGGQAGGSGCGRLRGGSLVGAADERGSGSSGGEYDLVVTLEDNLVEGGVGQKLPPRPAPTRSPARRRGC